ncbi:MAG: dTDP-4-dehydrorhamnose 3,5-epimerase [Spirochaetota bacterium]|nr:dTDP-4-dehydrorhamnose 3,5-epimerase [Spirochaetota bacterium]
MKFIETPLKGAFIIELDEIKDDRGFFARSWCKKEFKDLGLNPKLVQCSISFNKKKGTLRGMHFQVKPHEEAKLIRCTMGKLYDVIIDLRPNSKTYKQWFSIELSQDNRKMLYIPEAFAHGFQTLTDNTEIFYQMSQFFHEESASGVSWDDPTFNILWPIKEIIISDKDKAYPKLI